MAAEIPYGAPGDRAFPPLPDREDDTGNSMPGGYPAYRMMKQGIPAGMSATESLRNWCGAGGAGEP